MDHPLYLAWAQMPAGKPIFPYRGPLATSGIENMRDGAFRSQRAAYRIEIGNEGWNFSIGDPYTTTVDFIVGYNDSQLNKNAQQLFGSQLVNALNDNLTRQFRLGFLVEQTPEDGNFVSLSSATDHLGLPRPQINYDISDYTLKGLLSAQQTASTIFKNMGAKEFTTQPKVGRSNRRARAGHEVARQVLRLRPRGRHLLHGVRQDQVGVRPEPALVGSPEPVPHRKRRVPDRGDGQPDADDRGAVVDGGERDPDDGPEIATALASFGSSNTDRSAGLSASTAAPARPAIVPIIRKKFAFSMLLQKPPSQPPNTSPGNVAANHNPIISESTRGGARREISARPTGARCSSPMVTTVK